MGLRFTRAKERGDWWKTWRRGYHGGNWSRRFGEPGGWIIMDWTNLWGYEEGAEVDRAAFEF
jgi:hypothetical protein